MIDLCSGPDPETDLFISPTPTSSKSCEEDQDNIFTNDPAKWVINDFFCEYIAKHGCNRNKEADFRSSKLTYKTTSRYMSMSLFERKMQNGEVANRLWPAK